VAKDVVAACKGRRTDKTERCQYSPFSLRLEVGPGRIARVSWSKPTEGFGRTVPIHATGWQPSRRGRLNPMSLATRNDRLTAIQDWHDPIMKIITERGAEMKNAATGPRVAAVRDNNGKNADRGVTSLTPKVATELREHENQIAIEVGEWNENTAIQIVKPTTQGPADVSQRAPIMT
jgi:hypothetical protein